MPARQTKTNETLKRAVLDAALSRAGAVGFTQKLLAAAGREAGVDEIARLFPLGIPSLLEFYSREVDGDLERRLGALDLAVLPVRKRISSAVLTRLEILNPDKDAARRAAAHLSLPSNLPLAARLVYATVDTMWRAAGDRSTDFNFYTKRGILAGVYTATLLHWFGDTSDKARDTETFLAARIENVLQYEKLKARLRQDAGRGLDRLTDVLRTACR